MAKRISTTKTKNSCNYYIIEDFTDPSSMKRSTFIFEKLGSIDNLKSRFQVDTDEDALSKLKEYLNDLKASDRIARETVSVTFSPHKLIEKNKERLFNLGYLYPKSILKSLGIKKICDDVVERYQFKFDLNDILCDLVSTRIIYPGSKRASFNDASSFIEPPKYQLHDIYRALPILAKERYFIESELYKSSKLNYSRNNSVLYYDCTNFYFEIEDETDLCKYGKSKENRPNPIVQYGLFTDTDGIPIADIVFDGNKNEQFSLRDLEEEIANDFHLSKFIVCADAGLNGFDNKVYNDMKLNGAYIVTQPIKKLKSNLKEWATDTRDWYLLNLPGTYDISRLEDTLCIEGKTYNTNDLVFYKDRWEKTSKKTSVTSNKYTLEEHIVITYSRKYAEYQRYIREKKLERARKLIASNPGKIDSHNPRDPRYYISKIKTTPAGEVAEENHFTINDSLIIEEMRYDGFYAVTTDLEDNNLSLIIEANKRRWEIEESFEIMKSEFKARPMYVTHEESVKGHLLTCFISLLVYRLLEKKHLKEAYTCNQIISTLRKLNITYIGGNNYIPSFKRTDITDSLAEEFGFQPARELLTQKYLKKFIRVANSKKITKMKES